MVTQQFVLFSISSYLFYSPLSHTYDTQTRQIHYTQHTIHQTSVHKLYITEKIQPTLQYTFMISGINIFPDRASKQQNMHSNEHVIENIQ